MVCVGCIADWSDKFEDVLVNCMRQSTNFPGQLDRASATFPLIMYYTVFHHLFLGKSYSIQDETIQKIEQCFKQKLLNLLISIYNSLFPCTL